LLAQQCQPCLFQTDIVVVVEIVETDNRVTPGQQALGRMKANEARGSGDEDFKIRHLKLSSRV